MRRRGFLVGSAFTPGAFGIQPRSVRRTHRVRPHHTLSAGQIGLTQAHLSGWDLDQAAAFGRDALRIAGNLSSTIILERLCAL